MDAWLLAQCEWLLDKFVQVFGVGLSRFYWVYLLSFVLSAAILFWLRAPREERYSPRRLLAYVFPKHIYLHASTALDLQLYICNRIFSPARIVLGFMSVAFVASYVDAGLTWTFGETQSLLAHDFWAAVIFTIGLMAALDLAEYITHRLHHEIPALWAFHKLHHSAEVMTPLTALRSHPVHDVIDTIIRALFGGVFQGAFVYAAAGEVAAVEIFGANAVLALFYSFGYHLRHSHMWLGWGRFLSCIVISPAQHQIHHSYLPQHLNKNYGEIFAVWDWMFGTVYIPQKSEELKLGTGAEQPHPNLWRAYATPFVECYRLLGHGSHGSRSESALLDQGHSVRR
jgi:sterol desaturase/sphingolipid hydroxylase (fatty acid hydroxylase superfamily)